MTIPKSSVDPRIIEAYEFINDGFDVPDNFGGLPEKFSSYDDSRFVIIPVPFEGTVSYSGGTGSGPHAIIEASQHVELYDIETDSSPFIEGIATLEPVEADNVKDLLSLLETKVSEVIDAGKIPVVLGGEHSVTLAPVRAFAKRGPIGILQLDAHSDLRNEYDGNPLSHACVMRRSIELDNVRHLSQAGIRAVSVYEVESLKRPDVTTEHPFNLSPDWIDRLIEPLPENVYVTVDVDAFDPSLIPSTGTPEPGGMTWHEAMRLLREVSNRRNVVGFDVVELAPIASLHHPEFSMALLTYKMMAYLLAK